MAFTHSLHNSSLGYLDLHNLGLLNADKSSSSCLYKMENNNAPCMVLPNGDNYSNFLSTGYLEDALHEFSVRFKRRRLMTCSTNDLHEEVHHDLLSTHFTDDLSYWNNWLTNYNMHSQEDQLLSHASLLVNHDMHYSYSSGESMEKSMKEMCEELIYYPETNKSSSTLLLEEIVGSTSPKKLQVELSSCSTRDDHSFKNKSTSDLVYSNDTYSTDTTSSISGDKETKKYDKRNSTKRSSSTKMVYPFGLVKPGGEDGDITLDDINRRMLKPPTRALKHPVGDYACRPAVSPHGPGLSGKAVVGLTKIQTQGRGTITIIRTKG